MLLLISNTDFEQRDLDRQISESLDEKNLEMMSNDWEKYRSIIKDYYQDIIIGKNFEVDIVNKIINAINKFAAYMYKKEKYQVKFRNICKKLDRFDY